MARTQNLALNPQKISGNCGRLLCCLMYEQKYYEQSLPEYPQVGSRYLLNKEEGTIDKFNIFFEEITIRMTDGDPRVISLSEYKRACQRGQCVLLEKPKQINHNGRDIQEE